MKVRDTYKGQGLVFMVACPRSGTSWLQRMLAASSPLIKTGPETFLFKNYIGPQLDTWDIAKEKDMTNLHNYMTRKEFISKLKSYTIDLLKPIIDNIKANEIFIEKTNSHALFLPLIREMFPESKIINVIRDPRDVVASWLAASRTWAKGGPPKSAKEFAIFWKNCILTTEKIKKETDKNYFFELRYEDLLNNTFSTLVNVLRFLKISVDEGHLRKVISDHGIENMKRGKKYYRITLKGEVGGVKGIIWDEPEGFFRKGKIGSWKNDLDFWEKYQVGKITGKLMRKLNYS